MTSKQSFEFDGDSIPKAYDSVLVPMVFEPWAQMLLETLPPDPAWQVLDLATGTGIVAHKLANKIGPAGSITAADLSPEMLAIARQRYLAAPQSVRFIETPAHPLNLDDAAFDAVYCQQGFQFFPDKPAAAKEIHRVLRPAGQLAVSAWCPVDQCVFFGLVCDALNECEENDIAEMMAMPFNHMPADELLSHFESAGFEKVKVLKHEKLMVIEEGPKAAYQSVFATPIGPRLRALAEDKLSRFHQAMMSRLTKITTDGMTKANMVSLVLTAKKLS